MRKIRSDEGHRILFAAGQMGEKLSVAGKAISAEKERSLVDWGSRDRINTSRRTQLDGGFDVACGSFSSRTRFNARFNESADVIEMKNDRLGEFFRDGFTLANDVVAALQDRVSGRCGPATARRR